MRAPAPGFELVEHRDVLAIPGHFCLYDLRGHRIDASRHWTFDRFIGPEPPAIEVPTDLTVIDEPVLYAGLIPKPHFGHFLLEAFTRLWPYEDPGLRDLPHLHHLHWGRELLPFEQELLAAATAEVRGPMLRVDRPRLLRTALVPSQSIVLEQPIPPRALGVYDRIRTRIAGAVEEDDRPLYLSRSRVATGRRRTLGERSLEERLHAAGVRVLHPQEESLEEQIRTVAGAPTVIGLFGSALHLTIFRDLPGARTIALTPATPSRIQLEIDRARGARSAGWRAEYPLHPRHPRIRRGRALALGPYRNVLLPGPTAARVLAATG